jgi:hypothetical protein
VYGFSMNGKTQRQWVGQGTAKVVKALSIGPLASLACSSLWLGGAQPQAYGATLSAQATTSPAPPGLVGLLRQLDTAASRQDLDVTLKFYSSSFTHTDGLDYKTFGQALKAFWQNASAQYTTQIDRWQAQGADKYVLETTTTLQGKQKAAEREMALTATVRSRITIAGQKIMSQEILSEQSRLTSGDKPPIVTINLPEQVKVGQTFSFDAIVKDPLGDDLLLGSAVEEVITPERYLQPTVVALEPLSSGGLFKVGQAPQQPTRQWVSAVLIKGNGMTIVSQRLSVVEPNASTRPTPR